jgi:glycosyltransferase involved in cell wall biosynthesis
MRTTTLFISNIAWEFAWQRHQTLASLFAQDSDVVFCEVPGVRRVGWRDLPRIFARLRQLGSRPAKSGEPVPPGLSIVRPWVLPATNRVFCALNAWLLNRCLTREPRLREGVDLIVNYSAARTALQLIARVPHRRLVYDCTDDWRAVRGIPVFLPNDEKWLLQRADLTMVPSRVLEARRAPDARRLVRVPHGAMVERFRVPARPRRADGGATVLYYGHLHRQHLDFDLIAGLAQRRPAWTIVLVGDVKTPEAFPANVRLAGAQPHRRLIEFIAEADVLILPYAINDYTRAVLPAKTYECLASGRPIVATPLPELVQEFSEHIRFATDADGFVGAVEASLAEDTPVRAGRRSELAAQNSWERRYREIRALILAGATEGSR